MLYRYELSCIENLLTAIQQAEEYGVTLRHGSYDVFIEDNQGKRRIAGSIVVSPTNDDGYVDFPVFNPKGGNADE
jgi:hypothetical protein